MLGKMSDYTELGFHYGSGYFVTTIYDICDKYLMMVIPNAKNEDT
jgi:hypothetical protein